MVVILDFADFSFLKVYKRQRKETEADPDETIALASEVQAVGELWEWEWMQWEWMQVVCACHLATSLPLPL